jgi:DNA-binding Lrp family transcriptional regulator
LHRRNLPRFAPFDRIETIKMMQESATSAVLDEFDRAIVHALQIYPRAPWSLVGDVLGADPVTITRRWRRMESAGLAWVTAYPKLTTQHAVTAVIEINTEPGANREVADTLANQPSTVNVKETAGGRDLIINVQATTIGDLARFIAHQLSTTDGVTGTHTHLVTSVPSEGSNWRLRSLDSDHCERLHAAARTTPARDRPASWDSLDARIATLLSTDGRMPLNALAQAAEASVTTTRRRVQQLIDTRLQLRCDLARPVSGWPLAAVYFASVPAEKLPEMSRALATVPETRSCAITAGPHNLIIDVWLRELSDVHALEAYLSSRLPPLVVSDRAVVLRTAKHMGRLLDTDGKCVGVVPVDLWSGAGHSTPASARTGRLDSRSMNRT